MSLEAIMNRIGGVERRRLWRWVGYMIILWLGLWTIHWSLHMQHRPDEVPLEEDKEAIEAFAQMYPLDL